MTTALQPHQHNHRLVSLHEEVAAGVLMQPNSGQDEPQARGPVAPVSGVGGGAEPRGVRPGTRGPECAVHQCIGQQSRYVFATAYHC